MPNLVRFGFSANVLKVYQLRDIGMRKNVMAAPSAEEDRAEVFWLAFKGLPKKEQHRSVEKLLQDPEFVENLLDIAIIEQRRTQPSRPLGEYLIE